MFQLRARIMCPGSFLMHILMSFLRIEHIEKDGKILLNQERTLLFEDEMF